MEVNRKHMLKSALVLGAFTLIAWLIASNGPSSKRQAPPDKPVLQVSSQVIVPTEYQFTLASFGTVQPRTQSLLVSQVSGVIDEVNPAFRDGGFFNKGDVLIRIDDRDYQASVKVAQAELLQAQLSLEEEKARSAQAEKDWQRLGDGEKASALVLRKPQMAAAEASVYSAQANYEKAQLDLERTHIRAPFNGRVKTAMVDLGQFVNSNSQLAEVFATDVVEVRLPLKNNELNLVELPENYRGLAVSPEDFPDVTIVSTLGQHEEWYGKIVRTEAAIDDNSHQLYIVAQIQDPFAIEQSGKSPLKIGQYVTAKIKGKTVEQALVVPTSSIYQGSYLFVIENGTLQRRDITLQFQNPQQAVIRTGLESGNEIITSPLGQVTSGTQVVVVESNKSELDTPDKPTEPNLDSLKSPTILSQPVPDNERSDNDEPVNAKPRNRESPDSTLQLSNTDSHKIASEAP